MIATIPIGQAPQASPTCRTRCRRGWYEGLQPLGVAGEAAHLTLAPASGDQGTGPTSVSLFDQGLTQVLQASVTGLEPRQPYVLALAGEADGRGELEPLSAFMTNPAGAAIVNAVGPIRQIVDVRSEAKPRYPVITSGVASDLGPVVQIQSAMATPPQP